MTLMLFVTVSISAQAKYQVVASSRYDMGHGTISIPLSNNIPGEEITITCSPKQGYGLSRGLFYAVKTATGYSAPVLAKNTSTYPDDRANESQTFSIVMPAADVEVWAFFAPLRTLQIHQTENGRLKPLYGVERTLPIDSNVVRNVALQPLKLRIVPDKIKGTDDHYELVDVEVTNVDKAFWQRDSDMITIYMPNEDETVHVTPTFGKPNYAVKVNSSAPNVHVELGNSTPRPREEVGVSLIADQGYIPTDFSIAGCNWWRVGKPYRQSDGRWRVDYRFKVDLQDVTISLGQERVYAFNVVDSVKSGRLQTYIPELIPDFPGVAHSGQQIPVLFKMPDGYSVKYTARNSSNQILKPEVFHNVLENSFADENMVGWTLTDDDAVKGLKIRTDIDADGNKYWRTSVKNGMWQEVSLAGYSYLKGLADKNGMVSVSAIASVNPRYARKAKVSVEVIGGQTTNSNMVVADLARKGDGWQTLFKAGKVDSQASELRLTVEAEADDPTRTNNYDGPLFDDLCLLLPVDRTTVKNEDVLVFTMGSSDVTIYYTPMSEQGRVVVDQKEHARVTLTNTATGEQGDSVKAMKGDLITIKGKYDEGWAIYGMRHTIVTGDSVILLLDSINTEAREVYYHFIKSDDKKTLVIPETDVVKVKVGDIYGGRVELDNEFAQAGEIVRFTVTPNAGATLKGFSLVPADRLTLIEENVDATTRGGTYSFVMPSSHVILTPEFVVPISAAEQLDSISEKQGEFYLTADIDLGNEWDKSIELFGHFDGREHQITYAGTKSLFANVYSRASVKHLNVQANVTADDFGVGGICMTNMGLIEDCVVSGRVKTNDWSGRVGGIAGKNDSEGGVISHCYVRCDSLEGPVACGIANQEEGATIRGCVFDGGFVNTDGDAYMVCNAEKNSTIEDNYYLAHDDNARGVVCDGVKETTSADIVGIVKGIADTYPVFATHIKNKFDGYAVALVKNAKVNVLDKPTETAAPGMTVSGTVSVSGNNHLDGILISAKDGSDQRSCAFVDHRNNSYSFSFEMPAHDVSIEFTTQQGRFIYTAQQFAAVHDKSGTFYLANDLNLNNWEKRVNLNSNFYGCGHTIRYDASDSFKGLFYKIRSKAVLDGLRVVGIVESNTDCAGIAFENQGTIRNCHFAGRITRMTQADTLTDKPKGRIAAIVFKETGKDSIKYCFATGELNCPGNQETVDKSPLSAHSQPHIVESHWVSSTQSGLSQDLLQQAEAVRNEYPVFAQSIIDQFSPCIIVGNDTIRQQRGQTLSELTITDGQPLACTGDVKVDRVIYKRKAGSRLEPWVLPFGFDRIAGSGSFEYHKIVEKDKLPDIGDANVLSLSGAPQAVAYKANEPWMVKSDGGDVDTYVLTSSDGPITIKSTYYNYIARYASIHDIGTVYVTYDSIPAETAREELLYVWDGSRQEFVSSDSTDILLQPQRYYLQFYNQTGKRVERYRDTQWAKNEAASKANRASAAPRRLASLVADGWQPVFLDPRSPQSVTARMLDYYDVACLTDVRSESFGDDGDSPISAVSLVYQMVGNRMELPTALPLLVRAKRADAEPLADVKTAAEVEALLLQSLIYEFYEDELDDLDSLLFDMPHYWCASFGNRLDIWPLPMPERYADWAGTGCMLFGDNSYDQSFGYTTASDSRTTTPMSYCITVLNTDTYELLPLMGNRVNVEFIDAPADDETTAIETLASEPSRTDEPNGPVYNLSGQRVKASYKGIILKNGRKVYRR